MKTSKIFSNYTSHPTYNVVHVVITTDELSQFLFTVVLDQKKGRVFDGVVGAAAEVDEYFEDTTTVPPEVQTAFAIIRPAMVAQLERDEKAPGAVPDWVEAMQRIIHARDFHAEYAHYPPAYDIEGMSFDDWAADIAGAVLTANGVINRIPIDDYGKE